MKRLLPLLLATFITGTILAQPTFQTDYYWLNTTYGNNTITGETMGLGFFAEMDRHIFGITFNVNNEVLPSPFVSKFPDIFSHDISFLYGRRWKEHFGYVGVYSGASLLIGENRGAFERRVDFMVNRIYEFYEVNNVTTVGLPLRAEVKLTPTKWMGVGIMAIGNINPRMSYGALVFSANFGLVNDKGALW